MRIVVRDLDAPFDDSPVEYMKCVCESLGIVTGRDVNKTAITVFRAIIEKSAIDMAFQVQIWRKNSRCLVEPLSINSTS